MKTAVVYYSLSGNVKETAEKIAAALSADLVALEPVSPLKGSGFASILKGGGQVTLGKKPPLKAMPDLSGFDRVILGTPVWAGKCAAPVWTFLSSGALSGKETAVFTFSGSGKDEKAIRQIRENAGSLTVTAALVDRRVPASKDNEGKIASFIEKLR